MKKIMILGGTGFLGYYTTLVALERGYEVGSISIDDINLKGWFPEQVHVQFADLFNAPEDKLAEMMKGYDYMIYSVGPDDRVTPPAPSYEFFHARLVDACAKCFRAAEKAGVKKSVVYNSYFAYFDRVHPELKLTEKHAYVRCRVEQAKILNEQKKKMEVVTLELPYIFGSMPERVPLWKGTFLDRFAYKKPIIFFPKGSTTMTHVRHIGEAGVGALEYGEDGARYPIGDVNKDYNFMLNTMMIAGLGKKRMIINPPVCLCVMGAKSIVKKDKKEGKEAGLNLVLVMKEILTKDLCVEQKVLDEVCEKLHISRGGLVEGIADTMNASYPNHSFK